MKKNVSGLIRGVASLVCFLALICMVNFCSKAYTKPEGSLTSLDRLTFIAGRVEVEVDGLYSTYFYNSTVKKIVFLPKTDETPYKKFECADLGNNVFAYFDSKTGTAYIYSKADNIIIDAAYNLFHGFIGLQEIDFGKKGRVILDKNEYSLAGAFANCYSLKAVDLSTFDLSGIKRIDAIFKDCHNLKSINFGNLNTSKVTSMEEMFSGCESLESIDLSGFNTSNVEDFRSMFSGCRRLKNLNLSSFDTSKARYMRNMFSQCNNLESLDLRNFNTSKINYMGSMFEGCEKLQTLDLSSFDTAGVTNTFNMFGGCISLKYLNLSSFDMSKVTNSGYMFRGCISLQTIDSPKNAPDGIDLPGEYTIDNNRDGVADSNVTYKTLPASPTSNHLISSGEKVDIVLSEGYVKVCEGDIEYHIYPDGRVVAVKILSAGSVKIDTVTARGVKYKVTEIADGACKGNVKIKSITISKSVTRIGKEAFRGCSKLKKVTIEANKKLSIGKYAFKKINKKCIIKIKGVKEKAKKKLLKAIKK